MKLAAVLAAVALAALAGRVLRGRPEGRSVVLFGLAFLPFTDLVERLSVNLVSTEWYRGDARGFEITVVDLLVVCLAVALPRARHPIPYRPLTLAYLAVAAASVLWAWDPLYAGFGAFRALRMTLFAAVVARAAEDDAVPPLLLAGLAWGLVAEGAQALWARYVGGAYQVAGSFAHQNSLGMAVNLVAPVYLALLLGHGKRRLLAGAALVAAVVCVVLSLSRGALVMLPAGLGLVYVGTVIRRPSKTLIRIGLAMALIASLVAWKAYDTIVDRFLNAPVESAEGRDTFVQAAQAMLDDHPLGVGLNNFSLALESEYAGRVGIDSAYDRSGIVHHVYWLTAAELGWLGLLVYVLLTGAPIALGLRWLRRARDDPRSDVIVGSTAGLAVTAAQGVLEWIPRQTLMSYLVWIQAALLLALVRQLRDRAGAARPARGARA